MFCTDVVRCLMKKTNQKGLGDQHNEPKQKWQRVPQKPWHNQGYEALPSRNGYEFTLVYTDIEENAQESTGSTGEAENAKRDLTAPATIDYVIRGSKAAVCPDETHAFITKSLKEIKEVDIARILCGLLNNNTEGFMYFGVISNSVIEGIKIGHTDRDTFKNGIDRIMNRCIVPEMRENSYDVIFAPVLCKEDPLADLRCNHPYMIELRVRPMVHVVYTVYQDRKCYIRRGTETIEYSVVQRKQDMLQAEDKQIEEYIQSQNISAMDLPELAAFVKKFLTEEKIDLKL